MLTQALQNLQHYSVRTWRKFDSLKSEESLKVLKYVSLIASGNNPILCDMKTEIAFLKLLTFTPVYSHITSKMVVKD